MNLTMLTESGGVVDTLPDDTAGQVVWGVVLALLIGGYFLAKRSRNKARDHYYAAKRREADLRDNDPDMKKDVD
jgi:hypothetical protein